MSHPQPIKRTYEDYHVAVICAMSFEMSAVRYMLDHPHPRLRSKKGDPNMYALGDLHGHNVVLACLPGQPGKGAAASVATNLERTFPSIKWRFLVGIGGGVPGGKHDIRLGDVVISMPEGQYGGVVQYDLGKATENNGFQQKGFLWPPPTHLRNAVGIMQSDHLNAKNKIKRYVELMLHKKEEEDDSDDDEPGLTAYKRPPPESDVLFHEDYPHDPQLPSCSDCDKSRIVDRQKRRTSKIHYGLIASGDAVVKSAARRRQWVRDLGDVLCFEMEAAGPMTELPCIVIRGISDYADSHKNDEWRYFAAAAAAASMKELLSYLDAEHLADESASAGAVPEGAAIGNPASGAGHITHAFYGTGISNTGSGNFSIGGNSHITGGDTHITRREILPIAWSPQTQLPGEARICEEVEDDQQAVAARLRI